MSKTTKNVVKTIEIEGNQDGITKVGAEKKEVIEMPTGSGIPVPKEESELSQLLGLVKDMSSTMTGLDERIKNIERDKGTLNASIATDEAIEKVKETEVKVIIDDTIQEKRLDPRYRKIVDETLGKQFLAWEEYEGCPESHFRFVIQVPEEFSSRPASDHTRANCDHDDNKCNIPSDLRSNTMTYAKGQNGVREWCMKVRNNLNRFYSSNGITSPFSIEGTNIT